MNCEQVQKLLSPYIDNVLEAGAMGDIARHLELCGECSKEHAALLETINMLKALGDEELPEGFNDRLMSRLKAENIKKRAWLPLWLPAGAAAAILVVLFLGIMPEYVHVDEPFIEAEQRQIQRAAINMDAGAAESSRVLDEGDQSGISAGSLSLYSGNQNTAQSGNPQDPAASQKGKTADRSDIIPQTSYRSNIYHLRQEYYPESIPGRNKEKQAAVNMPSKKLQPDESPEMRTTAFSTCPDDKAGGTPFMKVTVGDLEAASGKLADISRSFGGSIRKAPDKDELEAGKAEAFLVTLPGDSIQSFVDGISGLGEMVQDTVSREYDQSKPKPCNNSLEKLKKKREALANRLLRAVDPEEIKGLRQEIARIEAEIKAGTASEKEQPGPIEINILLEEKGN